VKSSIRMSYKIGPVTRDPTEILTRPAPPPDRTVRYGPGPEHVVDLRLSAAQRGPLVVFLHGGFWRARYDRTHAYPLADDLAGRGLPVALVEYRRVGQPGGGWPGTGDDVAAALAALPALVGDILDPTGYVLAGHSAGGHLALLNGARAGGVLALAPVADLALAYQLGLGSGAVADLMGDARPGDEIFQMADPALRPTRTRTVIVHGGDDRNVPVEVSRSYARLAGDCCQLVELPGVEHFAVIDPLSSAWPNVLVGLGPFIDAWTTKR